MVLGQNEMDQQMSSRTKAKYFGSLDDVVVGRDEGRGEIFLVANKLEGRGLKMRESEYICFKN